MDDLRQPSEAPGALPHPDPPSGYSLALNFLPFAQLSAGAFLVANLSPVLWQVAAGLAWIYLLPPVAVRLAHAIFGGWESRGSGQYTKAYRLWWFSAQMQVVFNRIVLLEEALRLVPGLYPLWLRLWGARVSAKIYWAPGAAVYDRSLLRIGSGVVIGARAMLSGHLAYKDSDGVFRVTVAPIELGDEVLIGACAGIGPGCRIEAGAEVPAASFLRPFTQWRRGPGPRVSRPRIRP